MQFTRGQKSKLSALTPSKDLTVRVFVPAPPQTEVDLSCFGLDANGKLAEEKFFIFYNNLTAPSNSVRLDKKAEGKADFQINLDSVPESVQKLVFVATLDGPGTMSQVGQARCSLHAQDQEVAVYNAHGTDFGSERAVMMMEVYRKGEWRMAAVGQGFDGGLQALLEHFGGQAEPPPAAPPPPEPKKVNLGKLTLEKRGDTQKLSLEKGGSFKPIHINLNWQSTKAKGLGGMLGRTQSADLDLGCMFQLKTGEKGVIQPLGNRFGSKMQVPYIFLDQDDRSGASATGENMYLFRPETIERCIVFAMIYEGSQNFTEVGGRVTVSDGKGTEITVHMDAPHPRLTFCAVCAIEAAGSGIAIRKEEMYFADHQECDMQYGFGFRWVAGSK